ncbi:MAG: ferredoxin--NADP reductase [Pseudomonadota bacterium]
MNQTTPVLPDAQTVLDVEHYTDRLFRFRTTRPASLRFRSGEFVMIGLMGDPDPDTGKAKPILRAYSIASPAWDDGLDFYSIKVPDGPLTSKLQKIKPGDQVILRPKPVGTLVHDALLPGKRLWLFSTGTGFAPFASILRDPETYEKFERVIVTHTCRDVAELAYSKAIIDHIRTDEMMAELLGEGGIGKLTYYPTTTREESPTMGRITTRLEDGSLFADLGVTGMTPAEDRAMICGSIGLNRDLKAILEGFGLEEGANSDPKHFVVERAFVG